MDLNYKYIENKSTTQNKSAEHSFFFFVFFYRKNRLCLKIHTISSMFFVSFFVSNKLFESDNIDNIEYANGGENEKRWLQYTQSYPSKIRHTTSLRHSIITNKNSNLIMPFLVQNDNKMIKGLTTLMNNPLKKSVLLLKNVLHIPRMHKALFV